MNAIRLFTLSLLVCLSGSKLIYAQTLQNYNGVFESGKASYQYYENENSDRIYHGSFKYTGSVYSYVGTFFENLRKGKWKISAVNKTYTNDKGKLLINSTLNANYKNGKMDSTWTFNSSIKIYNPKTKKPGTKINKIIATASFKENHFTGKFSFEKSFLSKTTVSGQFNDQGFADGTWIIKSPKQTEEIRYKNGMIYARVVKDFTTGEKLVSYDSTAFIEAFWKSYIPGNNYAELNGNLYLIDTIQLNNEALSPWVSEFYPVESFGNVVNPLYAYKKGQQVPKAYEVKIISCENDSNCFEAYKKRKQDELDRQNKLREEEAERIRLETLAKEEQLRLEQERERERQRLEELANNIKTADELAAAKRYKDAINYYLVANSMQADPALIEKVNLCQLSIRRIDSLHAVRKHLYLKLKNECDPIFENIAFTESMLKQKKKVYATNYVLCMNDLKKNFVPKMASYQYLDTQEAGAEALNFWTDEDQLSLDQLYELEHESKDIKAFQKAVEVASATNNKKKLRILNSSLNLSVIVHDMIKE